MPESLQQATAIHQGFVHKTTHAEVLVISVEPAGEDEWRCGISIPRGHWTCHPHAEEVPAVLWAEVIRQVGTAIGHLGYGLPLTTAFTIQSLNFTRLEQPARFPLHGPYETTVLVRVGDKATRKGHLTGMSLSYVFGNGQATGAAVCRCLTEDEYRVVRRHAPALDTTHKRFDTARIVSQQSGSSQKSTLHGVLGWDTRDPFIFDHPTDHLPGMLFTEATLEAHAILSEGATVQALTIVFHRFTEFTETVTVRARHSASGGITVSFLVGKEIVVEGWTAT